MLSKTSPLFHGLSLQNMREKEPKLALVVHTCNQSHWEDKTGGLPGVRGQSVLQSVTLSQRKSKHTGISFGGMHLMSLCPASIEITTAKRGDQGAHVIMVSGMPGFF